MMQGKLLIFGDKILNSIVMKINYGGKRVSATDIPIGLRWTPIDGRTPLNLFPYAGMMVLVVHPFVVPFF
jgi:hypothetical protein